MRGPRRGFDKQGSLQVRLHLPRRVPFAAPVRWRYAAAFSQHVVSPQIFKLSLLFRV